MNSLCSLNSKKLPFDGYDSDLEIRRQTLVEKGFFDFRSKKISKMEEIGEISQEIFLFRTTTSGQKPFDFTGKSARVVIASELQANLLRIAENPHQRKRTRAGIYLEGFLHPHFQDRKGYGWSQKETVELKATDPSSPLSIAIHYVQKASPHENHKGDCRVDFSDGRSDLFLKDHSIGSYGDISTKLQALLKQDLQKEKNFATLLLSYGKSLHAVSRKEIADTLICPKEKISPSLVQWVNNLCYLLFVKEIARRKNPEDPVKDLPFATSLTRSLKLVEQGIIPLKEVLASDAPFGSFTGINLGSDIGMYKAQCKIRRINRIYASLIPASDLKEKPNDLTKKASRQTRIKKELVQIFGSSSDQEVSSSSEED